MKGMLTLEELRQEVEYGNIDTVLACQVDMQGRLMGKRFHAQFFVDSAWEETHCCNYLLATDMEMETVEGYKSTSWEAGYGDYVMKPDLTTLRRTPWLEGTALVLCDMLDHKTYQPVPYSSRAILQKQIARLEVLGIAFFCFRYIKFQQGQRARSAPGRKRTLIFAVYGDLNVRFHQ